MSEIEVPFDAEAASEFHRLLLFGHPDLDHSDLGCHHPDVDSGRQYTYDEIVAMFDIEPFEEDLVKIELPPGYRIGNVLRFLYSKKTFSRVFEEQLTDMNIEYIDAVGDGSERLARWILVRGHIVLLTTMMTHAFSTTVCNLFRSFIGPPGGA